MNTLGYSGYAKLLRPKTDRMCLVAPDQGAYGLVLWVGRALMVANDPVLGGHAGGTLLYNDIEAEINHIQLPKPGLSHALFN